MQEELYLVYNSCSPNPYIGSLSRETEVRYYLTLKDAQEHLFKVMKSNSYYTCNMSVVIDNILKAISHTPINENNNIMFTNISEQGRSYHQIGKTLDGSFVFCDDFSVSNDMPDEIPRLHISIESKRFSKCEDFTISSEASGEEIVEFIEKYRKANFVTDEVPLSKF